MQQNPLAMLLLGLATGASGCVVEDTRLETLARHDSPTCNPNRIIVPLLAGKGTAIGEVEVSLNGDRMHIHYVPDGGWQLRQTRVALGETLDDILGHKPGCPTSGRFPTSDSFAPAVDEHEVIIDLVAMGLADAHELVIAAHAEVQSLLDRRESAWAEGPCCPGCSSIANNFSGPSGPRPNFTVDLRELRGLVLWNKLGSAEDVTHSEFGPHGTIVGHVAFVPTRHGNGFRPRPRLSNQNIPNNYIEFEGLQLGPQGSIEFWYRPDWVDDAVGHVVDILTYGIAEDAFDQHITVQFNDWQNRFITAVVDAGTAGVAIGEFAPIPGWSATEAFHVALTWNGYASVVSDRFKTFINGVALPGTSFYGDPMLDRWLPEAVLRLGSRLISGDWERHPWEGLDGVMQDLKIWNYPKTDFSIR